MSECRKNQEESKYLSVYIYMEKLKTGDSRNTFLKALMDEGSYHRLGARFQIAYLLLTGSTYKEITEVTGASTATVATVNREVRNNEEIRCIVSSMSGWGDKSEDEQIEKLLSICDSANKISQLIKGLLTNKEVENFEQRYEIAVRLRNGNTYIQISEEIGTSSSTIGSVNQLLANYRLELDLALQNTELSPKIQTPMVETDVPEKQVCIMSEIAETNTDNVPLVELDRILTKKEREIIEAIVELSKKQRIVKKVDIAKVLNVSRANITQNIKSLEIKKYVEVDPDNGNVHILSDCLSSNEMLFSGISKRKCATYTVYLNAIKALSEKKTEVYQKDVMEMLGYSVGTVSIAIREIEAEGLLKRGDKNNIIISEKGLLFLGDHVDSFRSSLIDSEIVTNNELIEDQQDDVEISLEDKILNSSQLKYVKAIRKLKSERLIVRAMDVADELGYSKASVSVALKGLRELGIITIENDGCLIITDYGKSVLDKQPTEELDRPVIDATNLSESQVIYMTAIWKLLQNRKVVRAIDLAEILGYSKASVSIALKKLREADYVIADKSGIQLTEKGLRLFDNDTNEQSNQEKDADEESRLEMVSKKLDEDSQVEVASRGFSEENQLEIANKESGGESQLEITDEELDEKSQLETANVEPDEKSQLLIADTELDEEVCDPVDVKADKPKAYQGDNNFIFVSYSHRNSDVAEQIISKLQKMGYRVWYDEGIEVGTTWDDNIANHVEACSCFIAMISNSYISSLNCIDELNFARDESKKIIMIYLEDVTLSAGMRLRLNRLQAIYYQNETHERFYEKLENSGAFKGLKE